MRERRRAREAALRVLYQMDMKGRISREEIDAGLNGLRLGGEALSYSRRLLEGVTEGLEEIDPLIEKSSEHWTLERMAVVDRNILRMAVYELLHCPDTPFKVVIDEAVELAKRYGSETSGAFINGILDRLAKELSPGSSDPERCAPAR